MLSKENQLDKYAPVAWSDTLAAHKDAQGLPPALRAKVKLALNPMSETADTQGLALASAVLDVIDNQQQEA